MTLFLNFMDFSSHFLIFLEGFGLLGLNWCDEADSTKIEGAELPSDSKFLNLQCDITKLNGVLWHAQDIFYETLVG